MGDMADLACEQEEFLPLELYDPRICWRTQFKGWIRIEDMTTQHLENTCAMLERNNNQEHPSYFALVEELERRNKK